MSLYNIEVEKNFLAVLLQYPDVWGEVSHVYTTDFSVVNQPIFAVIKQQLDTFPPQSVSTVILAEKLKAYNANLEGIDPYVYLDALRLKMVKKEEGLEILKELKRISSRREMIEKLRAAEMALVKKPDIDFDGMIGLVDRTMSSINTEYFKSDTVQIFESLPDLIEERGNNPVDAENMGYMGPFPSINQSIGSLIFPGSYVLIGSRTGGGKSSLGFFYNLYVAEKYGLPILHLDAAEMTVEQLQSRAVCCMSGGRIPLWAVKSGEWRKNKEWVDIIRGDIWPRVKKIRLHYQNVGSMTPAEVLTFIKRFYYRNVGRGNHLLIHDDYQKGIEALGKNASEHQAVGYKAGAVKTLITDEIIASYWTSVQNNKTGIYNGKNMSEIQDSEGAMGLSDRLIQQATNAFIMRFKVPEEIARENNKFGNVKFMEVKGRELLGKHFEKSLMPVKLPGGKYAKNYFNLLSHNFHYEDKGDLRQMMEIMGHAAVPLENNEDKKLL
jgi:hypothetical protein